MSNVTIPDIRQMTTVRLRATLTDNGVRIEWPGLTRVTAHIYSSAQRIVTGHCTVEVDASDPTVLICTYPAQQPQFLGVQKLIIQCDYQGQFSTFDREAFRFVATTDETSNNGTTIEDETAEVDIDVEDVDTSVLSGAIAAALAAADAANAATARVPYIGQNGNWYQWDDQAGDYIDTGVSATGAQGPAGQDGADGRDGGIIYPTFGIDAAMHLLMDTEQDTNRFALTGAGHLTVNI